MSPIRGHLPDNLRLAQTLWQKIQLFLIKKLKKKKNCCLMLLKIKPGHHRCDSYTPFTSWAMSSALNKFCRWHWATITPNHSLICVTYCIIAIFPFCIVSWLLWPPLIWLASEADQLWRSNDYFQKVSWKSIQWFMTCFAKRQSWLQSWLGKSWKDDIVHSVRVQNMHCRWLPAPTTSNSNSVSPQLR